MALPVVIVASGGLPMNRLSAHGGLPVTLAAQGLAVTEGLPGLGMPMTFVTEGGSVVLPVPPVTVTYATWNAADKGANIALSNGNLTADATAAGAYQAVRATISKSSGKFYWEASYTASAVSANQHIGVANATMSLATYIGSSNNGLALAGDGQIMRANTNVGTDGAPVLGSTISIAVDVDNKLIWFRVNGGNWNNNSANNPATSVGGITFAALGVPVFPAFSGGFNQGVLTANFGASAFSYAVPAGFTSGWTIQSGNDPTFANVELLLGFEGADAATTTTDQSPDARTVTFTGNAQIDTAQFKFGASSLLLDGVDDIITVPDSTDWDFTGQFTIECWFRPSVMTGGTKTLICKRGAASTNISWDFTATLAATSGIGFELSTDGTTTVHNVSAAAAGLLAANTWYHVAIDRDASNKIRVYLDGVMKASKTAATGTPFNSTNALSIGGRANTGQPFPGWIDEVRITSVARYASDSGFTVPSAAFPRS